MRARASGEIEGDPDRLFDRLQLLPAQASDPSSKAPPGHNPTLGRNFETMDPLEWLARMADHVPDPGKHRTHFYGHYANRVRGDRAAEEPGVAR